MFSGCGITGALRLHGADTGTPTLHDVRHATRALAHRGPDGEGVWDGRDVILGHRRLSLVGLDGSGAQPMTRDHLTLTYNGELYNFKDIRNLLKGDYAFESNTDTEVVLRAWQKWGPAAVREFDGMFAFGLWDESTQCLHLVRDRLGLKPLYYHRSHDSVSFASEVNALIRMGALSPKPNVDALVHQLLCSSTLEVDPTLTLVKGISAVPPASVLSIDVDGRTSSNSYWSHPEMAGSAGEDLAAGEFRETLDESVGSMLFAEVPVGAFLSGGLDSSAINAIAATDRAITSVTVSYQPEFRYGGSFDDVHHSRVLAHRYPNLDHHVFTHDDEISLIDIDDVCDLAALGDDVRHVNILTNYRCIRDLGLRAVLNGQGADEFMGGYVEKENFIDNVVDVSRPDPSTIKQLPRSRQSGALSQDVLSRRWAADERVLDFHASLPGCTVERAHRLLIHTQLRRVLQFEDFLSMAASVEARFPFLSNSMIELCFRTSFVGNICPSQRQGKMLLRAAVSDLLPQSLIARPKQVFPFPRAAALGRSLGRLATHVESELRSDALVQYLFDLPCAGRLSLLPPKTLWVILWVWRWHQKLNLPLEGTEQQRRSSGIPVS